MKCQFPGVRGLRADHWCSYVHNLHVEQKNNAAMVNSYIQSDGVQQRRFLKAIFKGVGLIIPDRSAGQM